MNLEEKIIQEAKKAIKSKNKTKILLLRGIQSELKNEKIKLQSKLTENDVIRIITKEAKLRKEAIKQYKKGKREDLASKEQAELDIIQEYLPKQINNNELQRLIDTTIKQVNAQSPADIGKIMSKIMPQLQGKADGNIVSKMVNKSLHKFSN